MTERLRGSVPLVVLLAVALLIAACGGGDETSEGDGTGASTESMAPAGDTGGDGGVPVTLADFSITTEASLPTGATSFAVTNSGPSEHELVVLKTDQDAGELPVGEGNTVDEAGMDLVDEVEDVAPGASATLDVELDAGHYALICNIPGHYELGMWANLEVA